MPKKLKACRRFKMGGVELHGLCSTQQCLFQFVDPPDASAVPGGFSPLVLVWVRKSLRTVSPGSMVLLYRSCFLSCWFVAFSLSKYSAKTSLAYVFQGNANMEWRRKKHQTQQNCLVGMV